MASGNGTVVVSYVSAPHAGYLKLFRAYAGSVLYILGREFISEFVPLVRHLPGVEPGEAAEMVRSLGIFSDVRVLTKEMLNDFQPAVVVMPDDDVSHAVAERYFHGSDARFDGRWKLRWDWGSSQKKMVPDGRTVTRGEFERRVMGEAFASAAKSSDWWRQVGAVLVRDGVILLAAYNKHLPNEHTAYHYGDPRSLFEQGVGIEVSVSGHAEVLLLATAARQGICTRGCELFVSTFPCPPCAYPVSYSGICRLYYAEGYALLNAADALDARQIEIIRVDMTHTPS